MVMLKLTLSFGSLLRSSETSVWRVDAPRNESVSMVKRVIIVRIAR